MAVSPDAGLAAMTALLLEATRQIDDAIAALGTNDEAATAAADAAIKTARRLEHNVLRRDREAARGRWHPQADLTSEAISAL